LKKGRIGKISLATVEKKWYAREVLCLEFWSLYMLWYGVRLPLR
jgi:hypothetical protein